MSEEIQQLEAQIAAIGRPDSVFAPLSALRANIEAKRRWDAANPEAAKRHFELVARLRELQEAAEMADVERRRNERMADKLEAAGVGDRSTTAAISPATQTAALEAVRRWFESGRTWCVLSGRPGVGKTVAATWAVREALRGGDTAAFRPAVVVAKLSMFDAGAGELAYLKRVDILVLDDYGAEMPSEFAKAQFHELLDARNESRSKTLLTTNLGRREFADRIGPRLVDRIAGDGVVHELTGASMRRREAP